MQIYSTCNANLLQNNKISFQSQVQLQKTGLLKRDTSRMMEDFLHAYREIKAILERKTPEGIEKIMSEFPNITIGENLVFHNCGEDKNSIHIKVAQSEKHKGLTYISRRKGNTEWTNRIFLESFMFNDTNKLISNFDQTRSKSFPEKREFFTEDEILKNQSNEKIIKLFNDLDPILLSFRKYLAKNLDKDLRLPDGEINFYFYCEVKKAIETCNKSIENSKRLSHKRRLKMNQEFTDLKPTSGSQTLIFQNLGDEKVTIYMTERVDPQGFNLTQLYINDNNGNPLKSFLIVDNKKFVSNLNPKAPNTLPDKYTFANVNEVEEQYLPEFKKYFKLYNDKLMEYKKYSTKIVDEAFSVKSIGSFSQTSIDTLSEAVDWYNIGKIKLRKLPQVVASSIKSRIENLAPMVGRTGIWLNDAENNRIVVFQPLYSKKHENLLKISIRDTKKGGNKEFLIHDNKYIVTNYNPQYPTIIPKKFKYASEYEIEDANIESVFRFIKNKCEELATKADKAFEKRESLANDLYTKNSNENPSKKTRQLKSKEKASRKQELEYAKQIKEFKKDCKSTFIEAFDKLNDIMSEFENGVLYNEGLENFNKAMAEILNKTKNFYSAQKKQS